jgi:NAD(P)-dependent dehydrogenase (short-subunit alcohol dehydrogenase family)
MELKLRDKHAVITGGGTGIGAVIADRLAEQGARITLMGRTQSTLDRKAGTLQQAQAVTVDVTDEDSVNTAFANARQSFGPVAILINNAGAADSAPFDRTDTALWQRMIGVNLHGTYLCTRAVFAEMKEARWGRIVNVASTAGIRGYAYVSAYCTAKHAVVGLTRALALETARAGITVNAVCPGYTQTELLDGALEKIMKKTGLSRADAEKQLMAVNPQQRFVQPEEVAATVAWLCLPGGESMTGQAIAICGGEVMP